MFLDAAEDGPHVSRTVVYQWHHDDKGGRTDIFYDKLDSNEPPIQPGSGIYGFCFFPYFTGKLKLCGQRFSNLQYATKDITQKLNKSWYKWVKKNKK